MPLQLSDHSIFMCTFDPAISSQPELDLQSSSSYCRICMIFDTLKSKLKLSFTTDITSGFLLHADKNGEHFCEEKLHNVNEKGKHICGENFHVDNLNPHNINKLSCTHHSAQETQHLCLPVTDLNNKRKHKWTTTLLNNR